MRLNALLERQFVKTAHNNRDKQFVAQAQTLSGRDLIQLYGMAE
jgi:hypothetical protein